MADQTEPTPIDPAPEDHPPQGGPLMSLVVGAICVIWGLSHLLQFLPYIVDLSAEQRASMGGTIGAVDNLMLIATGYFLGGSQGGRALADRLSKRATDT